MRMVIFANDDVLSARGVACVEVKSSLTLSVHQPDQAHKSFDGRPILFVGPEKFNE